MQETLRVKRDKLAEQLDEAKKLKANIDKRSSTVLSMLRKYLSDQVLADYDKFIKAKARLIMESRQINDKMASSQEQKTILKETTFWLWRRKKIFRGLAVIFSLSHPIFLPITL